MFKVGDKVRCIDDDCSGDILSVGSLYNVLHTYNVSARTLIIVSRTGEGWFHSRFELVTNTSTNLISKREREWSNV